MDIRTQIANHAYSSATRQAGNTHAGKNVGHTLGKLAQDFSETLAEGERTALSAMTGKADAQSLVEALAQTEVAVETAVTIRDKVVEAYQEILRMPV